MCGGGVVEVVGGYWLIFPAVYIVYFGAPGVCAGGFFCLNQNFENSRIFRMRRVMIMKGIHQGM